MSTTDKEIVIRPATLGDVDAILSLVRELAEYEQGLEKVTVTPQSYRADFQAGHFLALVAEMEGEIVGTTIYYMTFSTWKGKMMYLEDFIVRERLRRSGIGRLLFEAFIQEARKAGAVMCKWQVLRWNELAINFYKKYETVFDDEWVDVKMYF